MCPLLHAEKETSIQPHHRSERALRRRASNHRDWRNVLWRKHLEETAMELSEGSVTEAPCLDSQGECCPELMPSVEVRSSSSPPSPRGHNEIQSFPLPFLTLLREGLGERYAIASVSQSIQLVTQKFTCIFPVPPVAQTCLTIYAETLPPKSIIYPREHGWDTSAVAPNGYQNHAPSWNTAPCSSICIIPSL